ncbi:MAG TPA: hypothetical protein VE988_21090 [Gemmataceae bacterium]|nr:hypothetical protein [Gemmataceae bacterium]
MRKLILAAVIVVCACGAQTRENTGRDDWKEFRSKEFGFRAMFPADPQSMANKAGALEIKTFMVDLKDRAYSVLVSDIPGAQFENEKLTEDRLDGAMKGVASNLKVEKESKITIGGVLRGRELMGVNNMGLAIRGRLFLVNGRLYQVLVGGPREFVNGPEASKFLDSFMLTQ